MKDGKVLILLLLRAEKERRNKWFLSVLIERGLFVWGEVVEAGSSSAGLGAALGGGRSPGKTSRGSSVDEAEDAG